MAMGRGGTRSRAWFMHMHTWSVIWFVDWPRIPGYRRAKGGVAQQSGVAARKWRRFR